MSSAAKVCAVFGYGPGLGAALAKKWSKEGFSVAIMSRTLDKVKDAESSIPNSKGYACDVTNPDDIASTVASIEKDLGPIDCLIYNAGSGVWKQWHEIPIDQFEEGFRTNVSGLLKASQEIVPKMVERGGGSVLITGATASLRGKPFTAGFAPPKAAQRMLAQSLARDLGPKNVHVGYFIIDGQIGVDDSNPKKIDPNAIADTYFHVANQPKSCWSFETEVRPSVETW
jgi:NAD(P)-dependent dehydrogenase (short-subunit alcohol dehydrogenase family)